MAAPQFIVTVLVNVILISEAWDGWNEDMSILANYLTPQKYFGKDKRFKGNKAMFAEQNFYKQFPHPPLKRVHSRIMEACDRGLLSCVDEIKTTALKSWSLQSTWYGKHGRTVKLSAFDDRFTPHESELEEFQYRTSAVYYMCWFTMLRNFKLSRVMEGANCLDNIKESNDLIEFKKGKDWFPIEDTRTDETPFQCAEMYFCPEPCYALKTHGLMSTSYSRSSDVSNPCHDLKRNDECMWMPSANTNMDAMMRGKLNYTCRCVENFQKGFGWNLDYKICIDIDECFEKTATCPGDQICQNTRGGYMCHCKRGFKHNMNTGACDEHFVLPKAKFVSKRKKPKPAGITFSRQLEILIGLESTAPCFIPHLTFTFFMCFNLFILN